MDKDILNSPIGASFQKRLKDTNTYYAETARCLDPSKFLFPEPSKETITDDAIPALRMAQLAIVSDYAFSTWLHLNDVFEKCESPIESTFLSGLIVAAVNAGWPIYAEGSCFSLDIEKRSACNILIFPQHTIGKYRADFLVKFTCDNHEKDETTGKTTIARKEYPLVVECDGHDFHEKTKEQASRDKERDRILQSCGYPVFRFSGSDIYRDAIKCAEECIKYLRCQAWGED